MPLSAPASGRNKRERQKTIATAELFFVVGCNEVKWASSRGRDTGNEPHRFNGVANLMALTALAAIGVVVRLRQSYCIQAAHSDVRERREER